MKRVQSFDDVSSVGSFTSSRDQAGVRLRSIGSVGEEEGPDDLQSGPSLEAGLFGVLYTLNRAKVLGGVVTGLARLLLDFLQQLAVLLHPSFGWYPWMDKWASGITWLWGGLSYLDFARKMGDNVSYAVYEGVLYALGGLLLLFLCGCVYVGISFRHHLTEHTRVVWMLRAVLEVLLQPFFVGIMGIPLFSISCHWLGPEGGNPVHRRGYLDSYPDRRCSDHPQVLNIVVGVVIAVLCGVTILATTASNLHVNPLTNGLLAAPHPHVEVRNLAAKTVFLLAGVVLVVDVPKLQSIIFAAAMAAQLFTTVRWVPFTTGWVNHLRAGLNMGLTWVAILMLVLRYSKSANEPLSRSAERLTTIMLVGLPCLVVVGVVVCMLRLHIASARATKAFSRAPSGAKQKDIYKFVDVFEVEVAARVCRTPGTVRGSRDEASVKLADCIHRGGIAMFPSSAYARILYANFLIEVQTLYQAGQSQLVASKKLSPSFVERYAMFEREQQHMQRANNQTSGENTVDLVSYVEFQRNHRLLARAMQNALTAQQAFWKQLLRSQVHFSQLTASFARIKAAQEHAIKTYRMVLNRHPNSFKLLRSYARFQADVMNNPWRAAQIFEKADKLEEQQAAAQDHMIFTSDNQSMLTQVDDRNNAVAVINASGTIHMTNKSLQKLFGYKASELEGQNVSILMPAPFSTRHNGYLAAYVSTGQAKVVDQVREVVALHRRRHVFAVKLAVTKLSGQGADSQFLGVIRPVESTSKAITAWVMMNGITLCVDDRFEDVFGISPADCIGRPFKDLMTEQDDFQGMLAAAMESGGTAVTAADTLARRSVRFRPRLHLQHKYAAHIQVNISIERGGTPDEPLHVLSITTAASASTASPLVVVNRGGNVVFASSAMSQLLGYTHKSFLLMNLEALMPDHTKSMHAVGLRELMQRKSGHSCRAGQTVLMCSSNKALVPVRLSMSHKAEGDDNLLTVVEATKSSVEAGLDERRVKLEVGPTGEIVSIMSFSSPVSLLGVSPAQLLGLNLFALVPDLGAIAATAQLQEEVVEEMRMLSMERQGPLYMRVKLGGTQLACGSGCNTAEQDRRASGQRILEAIPEAHDRFPPFGAPPPKAVATRASSSAWPATLAAATSRQPPFRTVSADSLTLHHLSSRVSAGGHSSAGGDAAGSSSNDPHITRETVFRRWRDNQDAAAAGAHSTGNAPSPPAPAPASLASLGPAAAAGRPGYQSQEPSIVGLASKSVTRSSRMSKYRQGAGLLGVTARPVILEVDCTNGDGNLVVSIWHPDKVAAVMEVSKEGGIRQAALDDLHPPGPLFGVTPTQLLQLNLRDVLGLPTHQSLLGFFYSVSSRGGDAVPSGGSGVGVQQAAGSQDVAPKARGPTGSRGSSNTHQSRRLPSPLIHVATVHADGKPLNLLVQAVPKRTSVSTFYVRAQIMPTTGHTQLVGMSGGSSSSSSGLLLAGLCGPGLLGPAYLPEGSPQLATANGGTTSSGEGPGGPFSTAAAIAAAMGASIGHQQGVLPGSNGLLAPAAGSCRTAPSYMPRTLHALGAQPPGLSGNSSSAAGAPRHEDQHPSSLPVEHSAGRARQLKQQDTISARPPSRAPSGTSASQRLASLAAAQSSTSPFVDSNLRTAPHQHQQQADGALAFWATRSSVSSGSQREMLGVGGGSNTVPRQLPRVTEIPVLQHVNALVAAGDSFTSLHENGLFQGTETGAYFGTLLAAAADGATHGGHGDNEEQRPTSSNSSTTTTNDHEDDPTYQERMEVLATLGPAADEDRPSSAAGIAPDTAPGGGGSRATGAGGDSDQDSTVMALRRTVVEPLAALGRRTMRRGLDMEDLLPPDMPTLDTLLDGVEGSPMEPSGRPPARLLSGGGTTAASPLSSTLIMTGSRSSAGAASPTKATQQAPAARITTANETARNSLTARWLNSSAATTGGAAVAAVVGCVEMRAANGINQQVAAPAMLQVDTAQLTERAAVKHGGGHAGDVLGGRLSTAGQHTLNPKPSSDGRDDDWRWQQASADVGMAAAAGPAAPQDRSDQAASRLPRQQTSSRRGTSSPPPSDSSETAHSMSNAGGGYQPDPYQERHTDFQRGKRLKRIQQVLARPDARKAINRFWGHSRLVTMFLLCSHVGCFIGIIVLLGRLTRCVEDIADSGMVLEHLHRAALDTRVLDQLHKNITQVPLYVAEDMAQYEESLRRQADSMETVFMDAYRKYPQRHPHQHHALGQLWDIIPMNVSLLTNAFTTPPKYTTKEMSLFEMGTRFIQYAREIAANHRYTVDMLGINLSDTRGFHFIQQEAVLTFTDAYIKVMDTGVLDCVNVASLTNSVMLALLVVEACCICGAAAIYLTWSLMQVSKYRCALFSIFVAIPSATIKTLASRQIDTDDSNQDDDASHTAGGDRKRVGRQPAAAGAVKANTRSPVNVTSITSGADPDHLRSRRAAVRYAAGVSRNTQTASRGPDLGLLGAAQPMTEGRESLHGFDDLADARAISTAPAPEISGLFQSTMRRTQGLGASVWRRFRTAAWQIRGSVIRFFKTRSKEMAGKSKILVANSLQKWWLVLPVVVWSILIITLYSVSYARLRALYHPIETTNVASFVMFRNTRLTHFAHEMCVTQDRADLLSHRKALSDRRLVAGVEYDVLLYGNRHFNASALAGIVNGVHRIGKSDGIAQSTAGIQDLLFFTRDCVRANQSTCFEPGNPLYQATHQGVNAMVETMFQSCDLLLLEPDRNVGIENPYHVALFKIGLNDARDGLIKVQGYYTDEMRDRIFQIESLHIALVAVMFPLFGVFIFYLVGRFVRYTQEEAVHAAKMLSELPQESDTTRLIESALGMEKAAAKALPTSTPSVNRLDRPNRFGLIPLRSGSLRV